MFTHLLDDKSNTEINLYDAHMKQGSCDPDPFKFLLHDIGWGGGHFKW